MQIQDASQIKNRILSFIGLRGPSLPVHIAKEINTSMLFASAFLSELISEKKIKISSLKVGNSSLYFVPGQEELLERFSQHLKSKEKEAFELLKNKKILRDSEQYPAIKVALKEIKDFAVPFKKDGELYWKYLAVSDQELIERMKEERPVSKIQITEEKAVERQAISEQPVAIPKEDRRSSAGLKKKDESIRFGEAELKKKEKAIKKNSQSVAGSKKNEGFFNKVKEFLAEKSIEISDIEGVNKDYLILKIRARGEERLLIAYNKKKLNEKDILGAYEKAKNLGLNYIILSLGEPSKKLNEFVKAVKILDSIERMK